MDVVVITGASAGIGRAIARELGRRRARVGLLARGVDGLEGAKREIEWMGGQALAIPTDVSDAEQIERAAEEVESAFGAAKHAIQGFTDSVHAELLHDNSAVKITEVNLPAVNTPQFDWVLSKLPNRAQPVPPIYQPELIADAIVWAAYHHRRSWNIGWPATKAIVGNNLVPACADRVLAREGYESQQTGEPEDPKRPNNVWQPLPGDHGAHGRFDDRARSRSLHITLNRYRMPLFAAAAAFVGAALLTRRIARSR